MVFLVAFPDYFKPETNVWWQEEMDRLYSDLFANNTGMKYDGIWIDMNEPASFVSGRPGPNGENLGIDGCADNLLNRPPYIPKSLRENGSGILFEKTICLDSLQHNPVTQNSDYHYNLHRKLL